MSTIGLDSLYYASITENASGDETYGTPEILAKAIKCDLSVDLAEAILYADDADANDVLRRKRSYGSGDRQPRSACFFGRRSGYFQKAY